MKKLRYGNTNTFYIDGNNGGLLVDTDYAGTLFSFFKAIKTASIDIHDISYILATHYHPDHIGIVSELQKLGITLLIADVQKSSVHFSDEIFFRDKRLNYNPIDDSISKVITCSESRDFLRNIGIDGEIIHTPSHSEDSVSLILNNGSCFVGDTEPLEYLEAYENNIKLKNDWNNILSFNPKRIFYAHVNEKILL